MSQLSMHNSISVVVPCFNGGRFLYSCLLSIANSTRFKHEVVVVDDGSNRFKDILILDQLKQVAQHQDLKVLRTSNFGLASARNAGLRKSQNRYIKFLDCDDLLMPLSLDNEISGLRNTKQSISLGGYLTTTPDGSRITFPKQPFEYTDFEVDHISELWERQVSIPIHTALFDREKLDLKWTDGLRNREDWVFWSTVGVSSKNLLRIQKTVAIYQLHDSNMTNVRTIKTALAWLEAYEIVSSQKQFSLSSLILMKSHFEKTYLRSGVALDFSRALCAGKEYFTLIGDYLRADLK
jgi:glycosyltransferase involved in cell wall biosynthesis